MAFLAGLLTVILVLDCVVLVGLVLIQLPKKDAGAGLAFGGAASDALFGAGSGNVLTKVTKYGAGIFFVLAIVLCIMQNHLGTRSTSSFSRKLSDTGSAPVGTLPMAPRTATPAVSNATLPTPPQAEQPATPPVSTPSTTTAPASTNAPSAPK